MPVPSFLKPILGPAVEKVLDLIPNKNERERAREGIERSLVEGALEASAAQARVNEREAGHASVFVAGWRPAIGWICGAALGWNYIAQPILMWIGFLSGHDLSGAPKLDTGELTTILLGMLGLGGLRSFEKFKRVARD